MRVSSVRKQTPQRFSDVEVFVAARRSQFPRQGARQSSAATPDLQDMLVGTEIAQRGDLRDHPVAAHAKQTDRNAETLRRDWKLRSKHYGSSAMRISATILAACLPRAKLLERKLTL
jgi:hypothetical protein